MTKTCSACKMDKPLDGFYTAKGYRLGVQGVCKDCQRVKHSERRAKRKAQPVDPANMKRCPRCEQMKPGRDFSRDPLRADGLRGECKVCAGRTKWLERYSLTPENYEKMLADQGGCCAICGTQGGSHGQSRLHVDHCHASSRVRGLLCGSCNRGLGLFRDNPAVMRRATAYLERDGAW